MDSFYLSYLKAFHNYAQSALNNELIRSLTSFALLINLKANELISRASKNKVDELPIIQEAIFKSGRSYVRKFILRLKLEQTRAEKNLILASSLVSKRAS